MSVGRLKLILSEEPKFVLCSRCACPRWQKGWCCRREIYIRRLADALPEDEKCFFAEQGLFNDEDSMGIFPR